MTSIQIIQKRKLQSIISFMIAIIMTLSACQVNIFAAEPITQGLWSIVNTGSSGTATYGELGFTYYSPTTELTYGASGGKDYVRSNNTNGAAKDGIVAMTGSYCEFPAKYDGTLTVYVGNASSKTGYVSKTTSSSSSNTEIATNDATMPLKGIVNDDSITFASGIDSLDYKEVGFIMEANGKEAERSTKTVYSAIPELGFSIDKAYMYSFTISDITDKNTSVKVTPYSVSASGEKVTYESAVFTMNNKESQSTNIGTFIPGGKGDFDNENFKVTQGSSYATLDIETEKNATYYITLTGSKMFCYGADFVPYTILSGGIEDSYSLSDIQLKFVNKADGKAVNAQINGNTYTVSLKPGEYSTALIGKNGTNYAVSSDTRLVTVEASETTEPKEQTNDIKIAESVSYAVSGNIKGIENIPNDMKLIFAPADTAAHEDVTAEISGGKYSARLIADETYTLKVEGGFDYTLSEDVVITNSDNTDVEKDITFKAVDTYEVNGGFLVLGDKRGEYKEKEFDPEAIVFTNVDDKYEYTGKAENGKYTVSLRNGTYEASVKSDNYSTSTHVTVNGADTSRDLLLKDISEKSVEYKDTVTVGEEGEYKTIQAAVDAISAMPRENGERVIVKIAPGEYREQVVVNTPNVTFEGTDKNNTKITWYYGIGYKYYSCVDSVYDPYADYDKFVKGDAVKYWGSAVITQAKATGFRAKDITFENSFNKYMTDEEIEDGAEPNGLQSINVARNENTDVDSRAATERAAALVNYADKTEFLNCSFIGSQDTLYTCNVAYDAYYKNCYIEGQTDFIYGNGDVIFDGCEINFCGYDGTKSAGYLTANSNSKDYDSTDGYIFRNCYVSYNKDRDVTAGYLGRMWGAKAKVAFINTSLQEKDMIVAEGWSPMSGNNPTSADVTLVEYNTTYNGEKVDMSARVAGAKDELDQSRYSVENVFIAKGWTPAYYTAESDKAPEFKTKPALFSNGDLNTPNPGETVTVSYELGDEWAANDASKIDWYAVAENFDNTSLESILKSASLLKTTTAIAGNKFQIPMACAGKYIMAVVTPTTLNGLSGKAEYIIRTEKTVSNNWSDPDNEGSIAPGSGINIYLAGDSTVKDYSAKGIYNGGKILSAGSWGEYLQRFFDEKYVTVNNYAQGGRSSRSFINEGKLDTIISNIKEGDYLLVQFGHNDCANGKSYYEERFCPLYTKDNQSESKSSGFPTIKGTQEMKVDTPSAYTSTYGTKYYSWDCGATYKGYLQMYIDAALEKGAIPVIVSPVARLYYDGNGNIRTHHDANMTDYEATLDYATENNAYVTACKELYEENKDKGVLYIDAYGITAKMYEDAYAAGSSDANGLAVMDTGDKTHSNKTGGVIQAGYIAKFIQESEEMSSVSKYVIQPTKVYGEETDGSFIFTIDKEGKFTAKDKELKVNSYWTKVGQNLFDSIGGKEIVPEKEVSLDFATDDAVALYETNAADTFKDGVYSGIYTNTDGQEFDISVYNNIQYYNSTAKYGTKLAVGKPLFSFTADTAAVYTITTKAGTGSGTVGIYTDKECTIPAASAAVGNDIVYKKTSDEAQVLYFAASEANNLYFAAASISYVIPKVLSLDFKDSNVMKTYEDESNYKDGIFAGEYTNADGDSFNTAIIYSGIAYYNHQSQYGTKATPKMPIFSIELNEKAMYTFEISAGTGNGTADLFKDVQCSESVISAEAPGTLIYKKKSAEPEKLYFATSSANNLYVSEVSVTKSELPQEEKVVFKGDVTGIEADDTNVELTLKGDTETIKVKYEEYKTNGVELIVGETYELTAKGDKGVYLGTSVVTDESGKADLILSRIEFDFPLDFMDNYDDYKIYLSAMGYGNNGNGVTDAYSGITVHNAGIVQTDAYKQYGVKTNSNDIISFNAKSSGTCNVKINVSVSNNDTFILKVNGTEVGTAVNALQGEDVTVSANVNEGDEVTLSTPSRSNLWYKSIDVTYSEVSVQNDESGSSSTINSKDMELTADETTLDISDENTAEAERIASEEIISEEIVSEEIVSEETKEVITENEEMENADDPESDVSEESEDISQDNESSVSESEREATDDMQSSLQE